MGALARRGQSVSQSHSLQVTAWGRHGVSFSVSVPRPHFSLSLLHYGVPGPAPSHPAPPLTLAIFMRSLRAEVAGISHLSPSPSPPPTPPPKTKCFPMPSLFINVKRRRRATYTLWLAPGAKYHYRQTHIRAKWIGVMVTCLLVWMAKRRRRRREREILTQKPKNAITLFVYIDQTHWRVFSGFRGGEAQGMERLYFIITLEAICDSSSSCPAKPPLDPLPV